MKKKLLLDENLPRPLKNDFSDTFEVATVHDMGWASLKNGQLLTAMTETGFEILLTVDKNLRHQQNLDKYAVKVIVLLTFDNRYKTLANFVSRIELEILNMPGETKVLMIDLKKG